MATCFMLVMNLVVLAQTQTVRTFTYAGPYPVQRPVMMDSTSVKSKKYLEHNLLDAVLDLKAVENGTLMTDSVLPTYANGDAIHMLGFTLTNSIYTTCDIEVNGVKHYNTYVDGQQRTGGHAELEPATHDIVIKYLSSEGKQDTISVNIDGKNIAIGTMGKEAKRTYSLYDVLHEKLYTAASISPDGKWLIASDSRQNPNASTTRTNWLWNLSNGTRQQVSGTRWMPRTTRFYYTRANEGVAGYTLYAIDPATMTTSVLATALPSSSFTMSPTEDFVIYEDSEDGPADDKDVHEIIEPDDRQPGWRKRSNLFMYNLNTGLVQQLTYGHHNISLHDISKDGKCILLSKYENITERMRPTDFSTLYCLNLSNMHMDTIYTQEGFADRALFSPDGKRILVSGSPEAFGGIGMNVNEGQTPSMYDKQLYIIDRDNPSHIIAATKDFNPSVTNMTWAEIDGNIYFSAEDKDCVHLFRLDPKTLRFTHIPTPEEVVGNWSIAANGNTIAWYGESATVSNRLYTLNTKTLKHRLIEDLHAEQYANVDLGECKPFNWINAEGDTICARFYLPPHFDATKQYPVIVNYYGGCSPTSRSFGNRYSAQAYSALGYIMLVINPRGASGFGQKWSAAHVNTAGQGIAEDIIGTVKAFCAEHPFVNAKKIGCIGASYGGFMTQYLQTQTDIFAAAVSHAGISDHTSYWGEGYWGYSYSQVSMANNYPWTNSKLFVDQSPLFNADKIHTPLLFVHGAADTNVPVGESIQMYTALKLLGRPTALVLVEGENHWIQNYKKRIKWQHTIWAWFAKYLQDDDSWWEHMYKHKDL